MSEKKSDRPRRNTAAGAGSLKEPQSRGKGRDDPAGQAEEQVEPGDRSLVWRLGDLTGSALRLAAKTTETSWKIGKALLLSPEKKKLLEEAGHSLRDLRLVTGMTLNELSAALDLKDKTFLEAVEDGTATLSFELILRLSSLLARHDPVPFIIQYTRTYDPDVWKFLSDWGVGRLPLQYERERQFINIYRRRDGVRKLSDADFQKLLDFTRASFDMALHFIGIPDEEPPREENPDPGD
jgi:hypothetical protein